LLAVAPRRRSAAVCPENRAAMLLCPNLRNGGGIQLAGSKQFSAYCSYAFGSTYAGDHVDPCKAHLGGRGGFEGPAGEEFDVAGS